MLLMTFCDVILVLAVLDLTCSHYRVLVVRVPNILPEASSAAAHDLALADELGVEFRAVKGE